MSPCNIKIFYFQEFFRAHHEFSDNFFMSNYFTVCDLRAITKNIAQSFYQRQNRETSWKFVVRRRRHQIKLRRSLLGQALHWRDRCRIYSDFFFEAVRDFNFVINDTAQRNMLRFFSFYFFSLSHSAAIFEPTQLQITQESGMLSARWWWWSVARLYPLLFAMCISRTHAVHWGGVACAALSLLYLSSRHHMW